MKFVLNQPFDTDRAAVDVDPGLKPGVYRFRLVVFNDRGRPSAPAEVDIAIFSTGPILPPIGPLPGTVTPIGPIGPGTSLPPSSITPPAPPSPARPPRRGRTTPNPPPP